MFLLFLLISWTLPALAVSPDDLLPESQGCEQAIEKSAFPQIDCQSKGKISSTDQPVIPFAKHQVLEVSKNQLSIEVKKKLFSLARNSYLEAVAMTEWMAEGNSTENRSRKPTSAGTRLAQSLAKLQESCGPELRDDVDKVIHLPADHRLDFKLSPNENETVRNQVSKKYFLAFLESSRLSLLLKDNYLLEPQRSLAIARLKKITSAYLKPAQKIKSVPGNTSDGPSDAAKSGRRRRDSAVLKSRPTLEPIKQIPANNLKEFHPPGWPQDLPSNVRLLKGTLPDGSQATYYESLVTSANGKTSKVWREIYFDKLTGTLDCNYPSGRELFEKLVVADAGKTNVVFIDIADVGKMNQLPGGREAADKVIKDIIEKLQKAGNGKITIGRFGGDEFVAKVDTTQLSEVKAILEKFRNRVREKSGASFDELSAQRRILEKNFAENPTPENKKKLAEFEKIAVPDVSIGSAQFGPGDIFPEILQTAETQAKGGKIRTKIMRGQSGEKYGDKRKPSPIIDLDFESLIKFPVPSKMTGNPRPSSLDPVDWENIPTQTLQLVPGSERRVQGGVLASFEDAQKKQRLIFTKTAGAPGISQSTPMQVEIPTRGNSGLIDAQHPESQKMIAAHFTRGKDQVILGSKLENLHEINYWDSGTEAGNVFLDAIGKALADAKTARSSDLASKMSGKDSFLSLNNVSENDLAGLQDRIRKDVVENPEVKKMVAKEIASLETKLAAATKKAASKDIKTYAEKIAILKDFQPKIVFQSLRRQDFPGISSFEEIVAAFEHKFKEPTK